MDRVKELQGALMTIKKECMSHMDCTYCPLANPKNYNDSIVYECICDGDYTPSEWKAQV